MYRNAFMCVLIGLLLIFAGPAGASVFNEGMIDKDLRFEGFSVTADGYVCGAIINTSKRTRPAVRLDMWITNVAETRIYWRKSLVLGDMAPGARIEIKENSDGSVDRSVRLQFMFRIPNKDNYRN